MRIIIDYKGNLLGLCSDNKQKELLAEHNLDVAYTAIQLVRSVGKRRQLEQMLKVTGCLGGLVYNYITTKIL